MSEKEKTSDEASLEEAIAEIAEEQPEAGQGDEPDHVELTALLEDARGKADEHIALHDGGSDQPDGISGTLQR